MRFLTWLILSFSLKALNAGSDANQPNVLVVMTDEHHYKTLSCYGSTIVQTPHIDSIARSGAICDAFYATTPVCSPSRASFMTGLYPQNTGVPQNNLPLKADIATFASVLKERGYQTGYAGKWHLEGQGKPQWAPPRKFGFSDNRFMFNRGHWKRFGFKDAQPIVDAHNAKGIPSYDLNNASNKSFSTDWLTDRAIDFIRSQASSPFCYVLSLPDPHGPNTVRAPYDNMFKNQAIPIPSTLRKPQNQIPEWARPDTKLREATLRNIMPAYYGMVKCIDDNIGRLLAELDRLKLKEKTILVFTSDHGDLCGEHGRLNKGVPYEGSARIPFLLSFPGNVPKGTRVSQALATVDFMPTLLGLMNIPSPAPLQGRDASSLFNGRHDGEWLDYAVLRGTSGGRWLTVISEKRKLVLSREDNPWLFDLNLDPDERTNRFHHPAARDDLLTLTRHLDSYLNLTADEFAEHPTMAKHIQALPR